MAKYTLGRVTERSECGDDGALLLATLLCRISSSRMAGVIAVFSLTLQDSLLPLLSFQCPQCTLQLKLIVLVCVCTHAELSQVISGRGTGGILEVVGYWW